MARRLWWTPHLTISMANSPQISVLPFKAHRHNSRETGVIALLVAVSTLIKIVWLPTKRTASTIVPVSHRTIWFAMANFSWRKRICTQTSWEQPIATNSTKISPSTRTSQGSILESWSARNLSMITMTSTSEEAMSSRSYKIEEPLSPPFFTYLLTSNK